MSNIDWSKLKTTVERESEQKKIEYDIWKVDRQSRVNNITVTVDNMIFDGDEISQGRMARSVIAADSLEDTTEWTLHDNSVVMVTISQLKTACRLAVEAQTAIWNEDRPTM